MPIIIPPELGRAARIHQNQLMSNWMDLVEAYINSMANVVTGTGTANYLAKWQSTTEITISVLYELAGKVGVNTLTPAYDFDVVGTVNATLFRGAGTSLTGVLLSASNLSDLGSAATARTNLGLAAVAASGLANDLSGTLGSGQLPWFIGGDVTTPAAGSNVLSIGAGRVTNAMLAGAIDLTTKVTGTLPVTNGGTGTATAFTLGSVVFAGASGVYTQDNTNFFWDNTNKRLGIGTTASPTYKLDVRGGGIAASNDGTAPLVTGRSFALSETAQVFWTLSDARGAVGSKTMGWVYDAGIALARAGIVFQDLGDNGTFVANRFTFFKDGSINFGGIAAPTVAGDFVISSGNVGINTTSPDAKLSVNGVASFGAGAVGAPSVAGFGDLDTGMWFPAANTLAWSTGGSERMRIDSSGNVGIGTTSILASAKLQVNGIIYQVNAFGAFGQLENTTGFGARWSLANNSTYRLQLTADGFTGITSTPILFDSSGNVGIANTSPVNKLDVTGSIGFGAPVTTTSATYTIAATDNDLICNRAGTVTVTLPAASSFTGRRITVRTITANTVVSASSNVVPAVGGAAGTAILAATAGKFAELISDGTNWQIQCSN